MDINNGITSLLFPTIEPTKNLNQSQTHNEAFVNISYLADNCLFNYEDESGANIINGLCLDDKNKRYYSVPSENNESHPILQTILGDLISSVKILDCRNSFLVEQNKELNERLEEFENNLRIIRKAVMEKSN